MYSSLAQVVPLQARDSYITCVSCILPLFCIAPVWIQNTETLMLLHSWNEIGNVLFCPAVLFCLLVKINHLQNVIYCTYRNKDYWNNIALIKCHYLYFYVRLGQTAGIFKSCPMWAVQNKWLLGLRSKKTKAKLFGEKNRFGTTGQTQTFLSPEYFVPTVRSECRFSPNTDRLDSGLWAEPENCPKWSRLSRSQNITYKNSREHSPPQSPNLDWKPGKFSYNTLY